MVLLPVGFLLYCALLDTHVRLRASLVALPPSCDTVPGPDMARAS